MVEACAVAENSSRLVDKMRCDKCGHEKDWHKRKKVDGEFIEHCVAMDREKPHIPCKCKKFKKRVYNQ